MPQFLWSDNFEAPPKDALDRYVVDAPPGAFRVKDGKLIARIRSDQDFDASKHRRRSEARLRDKSKPDAQIILVDPEGSTRFYALTVCVPPDWKKDDEKFVIWQAHQGKGKLSKDWVNGMGPPLSLHVWKDKVEFVHCHGTEEGDGPNRRTIKKWTLEEWVGKWHQLITRIRWDNRTKADGGKGSFTFWLDGKKIHEESGPQGYGVGGFETVAGVYAPGWAKDKNPKPGQEHEVWYREARIGNESNKTPDFS